MKDAEFDLEAKDQWMWTLMIMQPEWASKEIVDRAREEVTAKKQPPALPRLHFGGTVGGYRCRQFMLDPMRMNGQLSSGYTSSSAPRGSRRMASITKSISVTLAEPRQRSCAPSFVNRSAPDKSSIRLAGKTRGVCSPIFSWKSPLRTGPLPQMFNLGRTRCNPG
jgi:hypothetical protein